MKSKAKPESQNPFLWREHNIWHTPGPCFKSDSLDFSGIINNSMYTKT